MSIPHYEEISVKNLYPDAIQDKDVAIYLPTLEQSSGKLPERTFFFSVLATIKRDYLSEIIANAHKSRLKGEEGQRGSSAIMIKDSWLDELRKYPFISSKFNYLTLQRSVVLVKPQSFIRNVHFNS